MNQENPDIQTREDGPIGHIVLNRPKALNALSYGMITLIWASLARWEADKNITAVFISGAGDKAFCSGGDVKEAWRLGTEGLYEQQSQYFGSEYQLNRRLFHYPKPIIAFMDGITMGGGYGIGGNCAIRIATEKTVFAMPEVGIGFFTDVGSVYHLHRARGSMGRYLALTGGSISGADMVKAGLAEFYIESANEEKLVQALAQSGSDAAQVKDIVSGFHRDEPGPLQAHAAEIDAAFGQGCLPDIFEKLQPSAWGKSVLAGMMTKSPTSMIVTDQHLRAASERDFDAVMEADFILAQNFMNNPDFYEGIRAALIDKDKAPQWQPPSLEEAARAGVERYFKPTGITLANIAVSTG